MDKKEIRKRKKRRNSILKTLVLVVAFVVVIGATFGVTMAYFGGVSGTQTYDMILKTGLYVNAPTPTTLSKSMYVVPSQVITANCTVKVKSTTNSTTAATEVADPTSTEGKAEVAKHSNGLLRAKISFSAGGTNATLTSDGTKAYFPVSIGGSVVANLVEYPVAEGTKGDGYYYLVTGTTLTGDSTMYTIL